MKQIVDSPLAQPQPNERRTFLMSVAAIVIGGIVAVFPFAAGLGVLLDPLRRRSKSAGIADGDDAAKYVRVGPLDVLPPDGIPHQFVLRDDVVDAWTHLPAQRVGTAFLTRTDTADGPKITAFSSVCPHLGCAVDYLPAASEFACPCHDAFFAKDGAVLSGPSPRGLDPLPVEILDRNGGQEIWVAFQRFRMGVAERAPVA